MTFESQYRNKREFLLNNKSINSNNRELFKKFLEWEENKLKRTNGIRQLDENCYKTLYGYLAKLNNANLWFNNKDWSKITKEDIKKVYNDLEDGKIKNQKGLPFTDRQSYYHKIFKSKPFQMAGKDAISREVIEYFKPNNNEVRFIEEEDFIKLQRTAIKTIHKLLFWLSWDIGENINSLLQLKKKNFIRQLEPNTKEPEYLVFLEKSILKRTRKQRSEPTLYKETISLVDEVLKELKDEDYLFNFDYRNAKKLFDRAVRITKVKCKPKGDKPTWKDLRSGMACNLLKKGWSSDEVNARLGHRPSSEELDKYINYLAIDRHNPKKKLFDNQLQSVLSELEERKNIEKLMSLKLNNQSELVKNQGELLKKVVEELTNMKNEIIKYKIKS